MTVHFTEAGLAKLAAKQGSELLTKFAEKIADLGEWDETGVSADQATLFANDP